MSALDRVYWGNSVRSYAIAAGLALAFFVLVRLVRALVRWRLRKLAPQTENGFDDLALEIIDKTKSLPMLLVALHVGATSLDLPAKLHWVSKKVATTGVLLQIGFWMSAAIIFLVDQHRLRRPRDKPRLAPGATRLLSVVTRVGLWSGVVLLALGSFGINVSALVAGLGIGGIAVALAVQNILGDVFASLSITLDRPFEIGDFIVVDDMLGTVERVGIKTTRVRALSGEMLVFSNNDLLRSRIRNYQSMSERRVVFSVGATYQTSTELAEAIPALLREIIESQEKVRFDRAHMKALGDSALEYECVYYVLAPDYNVYMDIQQRINQQILRAFRERDIDFAYPTRTLWVEGSGAEALASQAG